MSEKDNRHRIRTGGHYAPMTGSEIMDFTRDPVEPIYLAPGAVSRFKSWAERAGVRCAKCDDVLYTPAGVPTEGDIIQDTDGLARKAGFDPIICKVCRGLEKGGPA